MHPVPYYPYRAARNRPYWRAFQALPPGDQTARGLAKMVSSSASAEFRAANAIGPEALACVMQESRFCHFLGDFFYGGEVVFDIARPLRDALAESDLGDATLSDLKFPFPTFYLHLGDGLGLTLNQGAADLEGAFITSDPDGDLGVALVGKLRKTPEHWAQRGLETFRFYLPAADLSLPLHEAIARRLEQALEPPAPAHDGARAQLVVEGREQERRLNEQNLPVAVKCMELVANVLLYLAQYPEDAQDAWQPGTPRSLADKYERAAGRSRETTLSKARSAGFTRVRRVGGQYEVDLLAEEHGGAAGSGPAPHLRRAHWRHQAHGPQLSLRRLVWIRAARVSGAAARGKPYRVS